MVFQLLSVAKNGNQLVRNKVTPHSLLIILTSHLIFNLKYYPGRVSVSTQSYLPFSKVKRIRYSKSCVSKNHRRRYERSQWKKTLTLSFLTKQEDIIYTTYSITSLLQQELIRKYDVFVALAPRLEENPFYFKPLFSESLC